MTREKDSKKNTSRENQKFSTRKKRESRNIDTGRKTQRNLDT